MPVMESILQQNARKHFEDSTRDPLVSLRLRAIDQIEKGGFPTTRQEEWRFTNVGPIVRTDFSPILKRDARPIHGERVSRFLLAGDEAVTVVFVGGFIDESLSRIPAGLPKGVVIEPLSKRVERNDPEVLALLGKLTPSDASAFTALNMAFFRDGLFIDIPDGVTLDCPIQLIHFSLPDELPRASYPRLLVRAGEKSSLTIVEIHAAAMDGMYLSSPVTEIHLGRHATLEHNRMHDENDGAFHIGATIVRQEESSSFTSNVISLNGSFIRNSVTALLDGEHCECTLNGLSLAGNGQLMDNHTMIVHAKPHCTSHELYKAILDGNSHGVFSGRVMVRPDAQKTNAKQTNKTLLLSPDAVMNAKPQLEIFADDVKCTHGATVGQIDDEQLLYLRTRGIGIKEAREMLTFAFASDVVSRIQLAPYRQKLETILQERLQLGNGNRHD